MLLFYGSALVAVISTIMVITRLNAVEALLYLIVSLLAVAVIFFELGAPFLAALEVIIYAGAIMVLFVFAMMLLNLGARTTEKEQSWLKPSMYVGPAILAIILAIECAWGLTVSPDLSAREVGPREVAVRLYSAYQIGVILTAFLLLAGLVGAFHLGREDRR